MCLTRSLRLSKKNSSRGKIQKTLAASCRAVLILDDLESLLGDANISRDVLDKIVDAYGDRTVEMAKNNAFQFVDVAGFAVSDKIALAAGMARNDARRIRAGVMESVRGVCKKTGCLCAETGAVLSTAYELLGNDVPAVAVQHGCETLCDSYALVKQGRWLYINRNAGSATHALLADVYQNGCFPASNGRDFLVFKRHIPPRPEAERAVFVDNNNVETGEITNAICKVTGRNDGYRNMSFVYTAVEDETGPFVEVILCQEQEVYHWVSAAKE